MDIAVEKTSYGDRQSYKIIQSNNIKPRAKFQIIHIITFKLLT